MPAAPVQAPIKAPPIPEGAGTVVIFGGSFDPPHRYHTLIPLEIAASRFGDDAWVLYVPAARSPLKNHGPVASDASRVAMLRLGLASARNCAVWTDEVDRAKWSRARGGEQPSFTIDTLRRLRSALPRGTRMRLLIGADQAIDFHRWKCCRQIVRLAEPLVMVRPPIENAAALRRAMDAKFWSPEERRVWGQRLVPCSPLPTSSTSVRAAIPGAPRVASAWQKSKVLREVPAAVAQYIIEHGLYGIAGPGNKASMRRSRITSPAS